MVVARQSAGRRQRRQMTPRLANDADLGLEKKARGLQLMRAPKSDTAPFDHSPACGAKECPL
jgi:hypothetical protein